MSAYKRTTLSNADYVRSWPNADVARRRSFRPVLCHSSNVPFWHLADIKLRPLFGRFGMESGHHWLVMSISAYDPQRRHAMHTGHLRTCAMGAMAPSRNVR